MMLTSPRDVLDHLGGYQAVAQLFGVSVDRVEKWGVAKHLPAKTYVVLKRELRSRGVDASDTVWNMIAPPSRKETS